MSKIPSEVKKLLQALKTELPKILGNDLFGLYVYGSLTYKAFNPATSDVDAVAVLKRDLNKRQLSKLRDFHHLLTTFGRRGDELELSYVNKHKFFTPSLVYERRGNRFIKVKYWDTFNPITWLNIRTSGFTLFGPKPLIWVPKVSRDHLEKALRKELEYYRKMIKKRPKARLWEQVYWVLTLCRIMFTKHEGTLPSKEQAGKWALKNLHKQWHRMIRLSLKYRPVYTKRKGLKIFNEKIPLFLKYIQQMIK